MRLKIFAGLSLVFAIFFSAGFAHAEEPDDGYGFYIKPEASYYRLELPEYAPIALRNPNNTINYRLVTEEGKLDGVLTEMTVGWKNHMAFAGNPLVLEASFYHSSMSATGSKVFDYDFPLRVGWYSIDGTQGAIGLAGGDDLAARTTRDALHFGGELIAGIELPVAERFTLFPFFGYSGMRIDQDFYTFAYEVQTPANILEFNEEVTGDYHGLTGGAKLTYEGERIGAHISAGLAAYHVQARYEGQQSSVIGNYQVSHSDSEDDWAGRCKVEGGLDYLLGHWKVGLNGGFEYISYVPRIIASDKATALGTLNGRPTHIGNGYSLSHKIGLGLQYEF